MDEFGEQWSEANYNCTTGGKIGSTEASGDANKIAFVNGNLAWYTLMEDPYFRNNTELATIMMNITGTVITSQAPGADDAGIVSVVIPPALEDGIEKERFDNIYKAFLYGSQAGTYDVFQCTPVSTNKTGCMTMTSLPTTLNTSWTGLYESIGDLVGGIIVNIRHDSPLTGDQESLIKSVQVPLLRYLSVIAASDNLMGNAERLAGDYTELIGQDLINRNLLAILGRIESDVVALPNNLREAPQVEKYLKRLKGTMKAVSTKQKEAEIGMTELFEMHDRIDAWEKAVIAAFDPRMRSVVLSAYRRQ